MTIFPTVTTDQLPDFHYLLQNGNLDNIFSFSPQDWNLPLEKENEKLLGTNVEMAEETRNLIVEKKQWADLEQVGYLDTLLDFLI